MSQGRKEAPGESECQQSFGGQIFSFFFNSTNKLSEASKHFHHWFSTSSARESVTSCLLTKPHQGLRSPGETARISLSCWSNCRGSLNDEYVEMPIWVTRAATNGIMQGLSFSLCLYSAYNQGTWPSWLPLETAAIQITNKNNGIKSEYVIQAILPQGKHNPPAARGEGREEEIFPTGRSSHGCCPWGFLDPSLKCLVLYSSLWETGYWTRWTSNLIHHGNSYDPIESLWIIQIFCKKSPTLHES